MNKMLYAVSYVLCAFDFVEDLQYYSKKSMYSLKKINVCLKCKKLKWSVIELQCQKTYDNLDLKCLTLY